MPLLRSLLALALCAPALGAQVRQLRAVPDETFDASALELSARPALVVDRQNRVYVIDRSAITLTRLSVDGRTAEPLVRGGAGPGEAQSFQGMGWRGDTLWFYDGRLIRFSFLDGNGKFIRTMPPNERCTTTYPMALMVGDSCVESLQLGSGPARPGTPAKPFPVIVISQDKQRVDTIGLQSLAHTTMSFVPKDGMFLTIQPFPDDVGFIPTMDGRSVLEIQRPAAESGRTDSVRIRRWVPGKGWSAWRSMRYEPLPLPSRAIDSALTAQAEQIKKFAGWVTLDSLQQRAYRPRFYPPAPMVGSNGEGTVWVKLVQAGNAPGASTLVMLDEVLAERARIAVPPGLTILAVRGNLCWGYSLDEDDVPTLVRYKLVPAT